MSSRPIRFTGANSVLSNFFPCYLQVPEYPDTTFNSAEHVFQYRNAGTNGYDGVADSILQAADGWEAKELAKGITHKTKMWEDAKASIAYNIMRTKVSKM